MSYIHFKSAFSVNFDKITFDGVSLPLSQLKKLISEKSKFQTSKQVNYDLEISNADTGQVYSNDTESILKNTRVSVKRIIKNSSEPLRAAPPKITSQTTYQNAQTAANASNSVAGSATASFQSQTVSQPIPPPASLPPPQQTAVQQQSPPTLPPASIAQPALPQLQPQVAPQVNPVSLPAPPPPSVIQPQPPVSKTVYDSLAPLSIPSKPIVYVNEPTASTAPSSDALKADSDSRMDEKAKLDAILLTSMKPGDSSGMGGHAPTRFGVPNIPGSNWPPRMPMINPANRPLHPNYRCVICKKPGHHKNLCPEAGTMPKLEERPKPPSGIPKSMLVPAQPGDKYAMYGPEGFVIPAIDQVALRNVKKDRPSFLDDEEEEQLRQKELAEAKLQHELFKIPAELRCPFGEHLIKDAVLVPCCGHFVCCDECIRQKISNYENIECPYDKCDQEIGSLSSITPYHDTRKKVSDYLVKMANQKSLATAQQQQQQSNGNTTPSDPFLDALLSDVSDEKPALSSEQLVLTKLSPKETFDKENKPNDSSPRNDFAAESVAKKSSPISGGASGAESPLQDNNISSSAQALLQQQAASQSTLTNSGNFPLTNNPNLAQPAMYQQPRPNIPGSSYPPQPPPGSSYPGQQQQNPFYPKNRPYMNSAAAIQQQRPVMPIMSHQQMSGPMMNQNQMYVPSQQPYGNPNVYMANPMQHQQHVYQSNRPIQTNGPYNQPIYGHPHHLQSHQPRHLSNQIMGAPGGMMPMMVGHQIPTQAQQHAMYAPTASGGPTVLPPQPAPPPASVIPGSAVHISIQAPPSAIMSEAEFYEYRERLRKESEAAQKAAAAAYVSKSSSGRGRYETRRRGGSYSRSRSRSYTRSRSRSPAAKKSRRSRSRSPKRHSKPSGSKSSRHNRGGGGRRTRSRSRSNERRRNHAKNNGSGGGQKSTASKNGTRSKSRSNSPVKPSKTEASSNPAAYVPTGSVSSMQIDSSSTENVNATRVRSHSPPATVKSPPSSWAVEESMKSAEPVPAAASKERSRSKSPTAAELTVKSEEEVERSDKSKKSSPHKKERSDKEKSERRSEKKKKTAGSESPAPAIRENEASATGATQRSVILTVTDDDLAAENEIKDKGYEQERREDNDEHVEENSPVKKKKKSKHSESTSTSSPSASSKDKEKKREKEKDREKKSSKHKKSKKSKHKKHRSSSKSRD